MNRRRVARVMDERDIRGVTRRKRRSPTRPDATAKPAPDLIGCDFHAERHGTKLVGDITATPWPAINAPNSSSTLWTWPMAGKPWSPAA
jgi:transposase InsO family protein